MEDCTLSELIVRVDIKSFESIHNIGAMIEQLNNDWHITWRAYLWVGVNT